MIKKVLLHGKHSGPYLIWTINHVDCVSRFTCLTSRVLRKFLMDLLTFLRSLKVAMDCNSYITCREIEASSRGTWFKIFKVGKHANCPGLGAPQGAWGLTTQRPTGSVVPAARPGLSTRSSGLMWVPSMEPALPSTWLPVRLDTACWVDVLPLELPIGQTQKVVPRCHYARASFWVKHPRSPG